MKMEVIVPSWLGKCHHGELHGSAMSYRFAPTQLVNIINLTFLFFITYAVVIKKLFLEHVNLENSRHVP